MNSRQTVHLDESGFYHTVRKNQPIIEFETPGELFGFSWRRRPSLAVSEKVCIPFSTSLVGSIRSARQFVRCSHGGSLGGVDSVEVLEASVDYLLAGHGGGKPPLHGQRLIRRFQSIEEFDAEARETIIKVLDAMIAKHNMASALKAMER